MGRQRGRPGPGIAATALLLVAGLGAGYAAAHAAGTPSPTPAPAAPVPADSPSVPVDTAPALTPDPDRPALRPGVPLVEASFGASPSRLTFPVPVGWVSTMNAPNEFKWKPRGYPNDTFALRVEHVGSQRRTVAEHRADRIRAVDEKEIGFAVLDASGNALDYTYIDDLGHRRRLFIRWLDLGGSDYAEAEVALSGRRRDAEGARDLVDRVADRVRQD